MFSHSFVFFLEYIFKKKQNNQSRQQQDRPLPKFGEWDVNDPASAEGFTVIFAKARDDKKTNASGRAPSQRRDNNKGQDEPTVTFL
ncbi:unnamed protein product [Brassica napus]|uniref:(rape) hypothetical protein n=1 Tax=Brassica napus TaxID=3708 RepID=A0A816QBM8_BRANA|nr:unnamed protein product [Brassica napus]